MRHRKCYAATVTLALLALAPAANAAPPAVRATSAMGLEATDVDRVAHRRCGGRRHCRGNDDRVYITPEGNYRVGPWLFGGGWRWDVDRDSPVARQRPSPN